MATLSIKNLYKSYDDEKFAVKDVNIEIADGEFLVLVGPSGCGKSTILRMIAGLEDITEGEIFIDDKIVNNVQPKDRDIAMVFQNYALYPHMTVYENISFGMKLRKFNKDEIEKRVIGASEILELEELLNRKPKQLSGGQRQRVALGRAIVRNPKVFLFDEPLSNLDAKLRVQMRTELSKLHAKLKTTMVYVTHDQTEAMTMGDKIVILNNGEVQQIDSPINLYKNPSNKFVAGFIGSPSMNFIEGKLSGSGKKSFISGEEELKIDVSSIVKSEVLQNNDLDVTLGIRPEDLSIIDNNVENKFTISTIVELAEPLGNETYLHFRLEDKPMIARVVTDKNLDVGEEVNLTFDLTKLHIFDNHSKVSRNR